MSLQKTSERFFELLKKGETLKAIDRFYHEDAEQIENDELPIKGKRSLYKLEERNIERVKWFSIEVLTVVIDEDAGKIMGEMVIKFETKDGKRKSLQEAFVQKWKEGQIIYQRFYYNSIKNDG